MLYLNSSMYGINAYKRLEVDYPSDTQIVKQPDANLSNYNTSLSRTVLHDENRYSDTQIRPKTAGKYEYLHDHPDVVDESSAHATNLAPLKRVQPSRIDEQPLPTHAPKQNEPSEYKTSTASDPSESLPPKKDQTAEHRQHADELKAIEISKHRKLVHETKSSIMAKKENYRKCKRRNRLLIFVFVIFLFILFAVIRRMSNPK